MLYCFSTMINDFKADSYSTALQCRRYCGPVIYFWVQIVVVSSVLLAVRVPMALPDFASAVQHHRARLTRSAYDPVAEIYCHTRLAMLYWLASILTLQANNIF